jgi:CDP-glucose 4,6-dehydratase
MESLGMTEAFWRGRRVLLTGHSGFKGGWLALWLHRLGAQVTGFSLPPPTTPSLFELARVASCTDSHFGDIRDARALAALVEKTQPEIVFHLAAQPLVRRSYADPLETYSTNVMGTANLLEAIRLKSPATRAIVVVTTDKCYENREWDWGYRETDPLGGHDPYSSSKAGTELVAASYAKSFFSAPGMPALATARAGNVIGGGDWAADRLVPDLLQALLAGQPARIRNPHATRPWQHVLEPLRGYLLLAERLHALGPAFAEAWNFGPLDDDAKPVQWIATELTRLWGPQATWVADPGEHPHEAHYLKLDISKARARLPWKPALRLADALQLTVDWARQHQAGQDMRVVTLAQIAHYLALPH